MKTFPCQFHSKYKNTGMRCPDEDVERNDVEVIEFDTVPVKREYNTNYGYCKISEFIKCLKYIKEKYGEDIYMNFGASNEMTDIMSCLYVTEETINENKNIFVSIN